MREQRLDPDELLRHVQDVEEKTHRGKLKIFLGACAGVGKTYAMLSEAHEQRARGVDLVVGYIETHGRKETDKLLAGLEVLPRLKLEHKGVTLEEFDLDGALKRKPQLLLVDELAHTNAPGSRHPKRYIDVEELIRSGIDVFTTINIQHLESLNDVVAQITGVQVRETIPDSLFDLADEVELIDIPPKELIQRLREGKVYMPQQAENAMRGFFREGNLSALRELALRRTADRVEAQMQSYRTEKAISGLWATRERILVCIAPNKFSTKLVRTARRMAESLHADVVAVYVESDRQSGRSPEDQARVREALRLAEELNMETVLLTAHDIVAEIMRVAQRRNVTQIVVGKPIKPRWKEIVGGSVVDELVRKSGDINVHVITSEEEKEAARPVRLPDRHGTAATYAWTLAAVAATTAFCFFLSLTHLAQVNLVMIYLLSVGFVSSRFGIREALLSSFLSVLAFDFFFVPPLYKFAVSDTQYFLTFAVMFGVALLISTLTQRLRVQADSAAARERRTRALYSLSRQLARSRGKKEIASATCDSVRDVIDGETAVLLADDGQRLAVAAWCGKDDKMPSIDTAVTEWAFKHGEPAGVGTDTLPGSDALYLPLKGTRTPVGVLVVRSGQEPIDGAQMDLLQAFSSQAALALERAFLAKESQNARLQIEAERLRNSLLSSVSHDLRTPLTAIAGAASTLMQSNTGESQRKELAQTIYEESDRLNRLVRNLLDMTRLESGETRLNVEWQSPEELIGSALRRTKEVLASHNVRTNVEPDLPLIKVDGVLIEQVLINLLENAGRHTPAGSEVEVKAIKSGGFIRFEVSDNGPGLPPGEEEKVFEKFHKARAEASTGGFGLGLAICRGILKAHNSQIWARNNSKGGTEFVFELKIDPVAKVDTSA